MKVFKMSTHALERLEQEFGMKPRAQLITEYCSKQKVLSMEGEEYIKFQGGVFVIKRDDKQINIVTYIGNGRMSHGKAARARSV